MGEVADTPPTILSNDMKAGMSVPNNSNFIRKIVRENRVRFLTAC